MARIRKSCSVHPHHALVHVVRISAFGEMGSPHRHTLRRYSSLPPHAQQRIFEAAPPMRNGKPGRKVPLRPGPT
jgi:hypothetical protein